MEFKTAIKINRVPFKKKNKFQDTGNILDHVTATEISDLYLFLFSINV